MKENKRKILLIDAFSTLHVGNGALIDNTYKLCKESLGGEVSILSVDADTNKGRFPVVEEDILTGYGKGWLSKLVYAICITVFFIIEYINTKLFKNKLGFLWKGRYKKWVQLVNESDICVSLSGETINDFYMPHLYMRLMLYKLAIVKGKSFVFFPQSIGPVFRKLTVYLLRKSLGDSIVIFARDFESYELAKNIWKGCPVKVSFCPDVATTQISLESEFPIKNKVKKIIGITVSDIPKKEMGFDGNYLDLLIENITKSISKECFQFLIMPSNYTKTGMSSDYLYCLRAKDILDGLGYEVSILNNEIIHPDFYQGLQKKLFAFISTRMHVGILATSAGIPSLMINTQHKIRSYMKIVNREDCVLDLDEIDKVGDKVLYILENREKISIELLEINKKIQNEVERSIREISGIL